MLEISQETYSGILAVEERRFVDKIVALLHATVPGMKGEPPQELAAQVMRLKDQARGYDMVSERAVAAYVLTAAQLGLDFIERFPGARQILFKPVPQKDKADLLEAFTMNLLKTLAR